MNIDDKVFRLAKRKASNKFEDVLTSYEEKLKLLNKQSKGGSIRSVYEEQDRIGDLIATLSYKEFLMEEYEKIFEHKGVEFTEEYLNNNSLIKKSFYKFSKKYVAAKKFLEKQKNGSE